MIIEKLDNGYVKYLCDNCNKEFKVKLTSLERRDSLDKQICRKCSIVLNNSVAKRKKTCLERYGSGNRVLSAEEKLKRDKTVYQKQRVDFSIIQKSFRDEGYTLLTKKYINRTQKLKYICPNKHKHYITWASWSKGSRCNICSYDKIRYSIDFVRNQLEKEGYTLLSTEYKNGTTPIQYMCPKGHKRSIRFHHWMQYGHRCGACSRIESKAELDIFNLIKENFSDAVSGDRQQISPLELDIYIPSKKLAIEYCGLYWHSEDFKDKDYHLDKLKKCQEKGIRLITLFEDEWLNKQEIVKSRLLHILGVSKAKRIHARKCIIKETDNQSKNNFLNKFHIQGQDTSSIRLGAFHNGQLVSLMTFSKGSLAKGNTGNKEGVYELNRFCTDSNYNIAGIASKLLKHFIRNYSSKEIYSYADKRWSDGDLYSKLNFEYSHDSRPNYWYLTENNCKRMHRFNFRKSVLKDKLEKFNPKLTEIQNMVNNGFHRVWDCGNSKWIIKECDLIDIKC